MDPVVPSLLQLCVQKLAQSLIRYGPKKVRFGRLSRLPRRALEALLDTLVAKNALNDNVLPHALTRQTRTLGLEGSSQLRRCVLNTIGRSCPNLRVLDVRSCQQVDNRIVRDVLQYCEHLTTLRLDNCARISDSAFAPALWKRPLAGLLGLKELSVGKCGQITAEGLMGYVMKGAPHLGTLGLTHCRLAITDEVASELLFSFGLEALDLSCCTQITDECFEARPASLLKELRVANTPITDAAVEGIAARAANLEVFDAGWVIRLSDLGVQALAEHCTRLRVLCVCNTQITDAAFHAIMRCRHLERLDASWCTRATSRALGILAGEDGDGAKRLPLKELVLIGALTLPGGDCLGSMAVPASPGLWGPPHGKGSTSASSSPMPWHWLHRMPPPMLDSLPPLSLPPTGREPGQTSPGFGHLCADDAVVGEELPPPALPLLPPAAAQHGSVFGLGDQTAPPLAPPALPLHSSVSAPSALSVARDLMQRHRSAELLLPSPSPSLKLLASAYGPTLEQLLLDGIRDIVDAPALEAIAANCPQLEQLALTLQPASRDRDQGGDVTLEAGLRAVGSACSRLWLLRLDSSLRPHRVAVATLALPGFSRLRSLTLWCCGKVGGLTDSEFESVLSGRTSLEALTVRNCEGLTEGLFPRWCNRGQRDDEVELTKRLDQALFADINFGFDLSDLGSPSPAALSSVSMQRLESDAVRPSRRKKDHRCPQALALRTVTYFSLDGTTAITDRSGDALAELLRDAQAVDLRGCPALTEECLGSLRKGCRFLRSVSIVTRERTLSWTASTREVKKHHRKLCFANSGSSGTESN
mmetsp:Transcript_11681/g.25583  ORF Transcript_11681/g.25583 Transcript_11681/m.25583 type:complete len:815 (-) Transcript_11681:110-2554(-)